MGRGLKFCRAVEHSSAVAAKLCSRVQVQTPVAKWTKASVFGTDIWGFESSQGCRTTYQCDRMNWVAVDTGLRCRRAHLGCRESRGSKAWRSRIEAIAPDCKSGGPWPTQVRVLSSPSGENVAEFCKGTGQQDGATGRRQPPFKGRTGERGSCRQYSPTPGDVRGWSPAVLSALGNRSMVGHLVLAQVIGVRVPIPQPSSRDTQELGGQQHKRAA